MAHDHCPVCQLYRHLAEVTGLLEDGIAYADQMGGLPAGLGGTIAQARGEVGKALVLVAPVSQMVAGPQVDTVARGLAILQGELAGWLDRSMWTTVVQQVRQLRSWAYAIAGAHFAAGR